MTILVNKLPAMESPGILVMIVRQTRREETNTSNRRKKIYKNRIGEKPRSEFSNNFQKDFLSFKRESVKHASGKFDENEV